ncbi:flagellar hook-associated protein FlgL [Arthrobacter sp. YD4]|uniref:flagellar hook-associated protein FlgL n=1 Tax=Arthrobacter sp. YD4 TaxID=3058043 RepID=UPI0025B380AD|nr:flagellar hook-associated protein FlgL [Arthrobacter sp. YD4]MDN3937708.1 flagellar hook-associated protein FlgL [Arthrobacter sp. YD4]
MLNRVTNLTMTAAAQRTLQTQQSKLADLQDKASTLNKISRPSDDPAATAQALETRALQAANAQYGRNIDDGNTWLSAADSALQQASNVMQRIKDLTVQAGNGTLPQSGKDAIANELDSLNQDLINVANSKHLGRNIFAGNSDKAAPFDGAMPPTFVAAGTSPVERRISETQTVRVDADGGTIFGSGTGSVFDTVNKLATDLRNGADTMPRVSEIDDAYKKIVNGRADVGARQAQLDRAGTVNTGMEASLDAQRTGIEKADLGSVIMDLKLQETNYQVALAATARVLQPTLMDFLR